MRRFHLLAAAALVAVLASPAAAAQPSATKCPSPVPGERCFTIDVPLDHSGATPGTQRLGFSLVPALGRRTGTIAVLVGGPGQSATSVARRLAALLTPVRRTQDLLLVDQRGTGLSGALRCPGLTQSGSPNALRTCGEQIGPRRAFYTAHEDALDLDDARSAAGIPQMSVLGISSGGRLAGVYARLFPDHVARLVLDSPEPVEGLDSLLTLRQLALPRVLREVCWPPSCRGFLAPDPLQGVGELARRLARAPLSGTVVSASGRPRRARLSATGLYALTTASDLDPFIRTRLPSAVAAALRGDSAPLLRLADDASGSGGSGGVNSARLLASDCIDSRLPWDPASDPASRPSALATALNSRPASAFAPFSRTSVLLLSVAATCLDWPATPAPPPVPSQGPAGVPVLVISGREDLRTPLEDARRTASQYPDAQVLAVPSTGHSVLSSDVSGCAVAGLTFFLANRPFTRCAPFRRSPDLFPYVPASLARLRPARGLHGLVGRTATALGITLDDAVREASELAEGGRRSAGGLRAGTVSVDTRRIVLKGYSLVRGVTLTGTMPLSTAQSGTILVGGRDAAPGRLVLRRARLRGTLGGLRVSLRVSLN